MTHWARVLPVPRPSNPKELLGPVKGRNIVYVYHLYPGVMPNQSPSVWEQSFGGVADDAPLVISEWGWEYGAPAPTSGLESTWGAPFKKYIESKGNISWIAWCFDSFYHPVMFDRDWVLLGGDKYMGEFTKQWLYEKRHDNQPEPLGRGH